MKVGYMTNAFGPLVGHGNGVICPKVVRYVTMCDMEEAIKAIASRGYTSVEIFDGNLDDYKDDPDKLTNLLKKYGVTLMGVYIGASYIYKDVLDDELFRIENTCKLASKLGAKHIVLGGGAVRAAGIKDSDYAFLATGIDKAAAIVKKYGMIPSYHPHLGCIVQSPDQIDKLFSLTDVAFCPDIAHLAAGGGDALELIQKYYDRIKYVHLKDLKNGEFVPLGTGEIDLEAIISFLKGRGYSGDWLVEIDGYSGDPCEACETSYKYLQGKL